MIDTKISSGIQMWLPSCGYLAVTSVTGLKFFLRKIGTDLIIISPGMLGEALYQPLTLG